MSFVKYASMKSSEIVYVLYIGSSVLVSALVVVVFCYLSLCYKGIFWDQWQLYKMLQIQVSLQLSPLAYRTLSQLSTGLKDFRGIFFLAFEF